MKRPMSAAFAGLPPSNLSAILGGSIPISRGMLKDVAPQVANVAVLLNPNSKPHAGIWRNIEAAAPGIGVRVTARHVRNLREIERAITAQAKQPNPCRFRKSHPA